VKRVPEAPGAPRSRGEGFVSVAEAARLWGVSERTAYRRAARLPDSDTLSEGGRVFVRQAALSTMGEVSEPGEEVPTLGGKTSDRGSDTVPTGGGPGVPRIDGEAGLREIIERQDREILFLRESLQREQVIALSATTDALELRRKLLSLESRPDPVESPSTGSDGSTVAPEGQSVPVEAPARQERGFWARLWGKK
jgi:hypothetical protein